jgi:2-keto-4-pentenoate hydratase
MTADRLSHGGAILGSVLVAPEDIDLTAETARATVNGELKAEGTSAYIMNQDPLGVAHWLANELPKHGLYLRKGDYILTGSLYENPTIVAGDKAMVSFQNLGQISIALAE